MQKFDNPLNHIKIASPCSADWSKMYGNERKRFCNSCNLNVYNLSDMTREEAENLLVNSEGRVCIKFYRRQDGTVLTQNCPVGWQAVKKRISRVTTAIFSTIVGLFSGIFAFNQIYFDTDSLMEKVVVQENETQIMGNYEPVEGGISNPKELKKLIKRQTSKKNNKIIAEPRDYVHRVEDEKVIAWIQ